MGAKLGASGGPMADINVTPLIDVVLVLLVVFMVVTPMIQAGIAVELPDAEQVTPDKDTGQFITITLTEDRGWFVDQRSVTEESLIEEINYEYRLNPQRAILIKADRELPYGEVRRCMDVLSENRMTSVFVAANKEA